MMGRFKSESEDNTINISWKKVKTVNKNELVSKMKKHGDRNEDLAKYIGISPQRFSAKLNETNGAEFTQGEIQKIIEKYNLTSEDTHLIFFAQSVS